MLHPQIVVCVVKVAGNLRSTGYTCQSKRHISLTSCFMSKPGPKWFCIVFCNVWLGVFGASHNKIGGMWGVVQRISFHEFSFDIWIWLRGWHESSEKTSSVSKSNALLLYPEVTMTFPGFHQVLTSIYFQDSGGKADQKPNRKLRKIKTNHIKIHLHFFV